MNVLILEVSIVYIDALCSLNPREDSVQALEPCGADDPMVSLRIVGRLHILLRKELL